MSTVPSTNGLVVNSPEWHSNTIKTEQSRPIIAQTSSVSFAFESGKAVSGEAISCPAIAWDAGGARERHDAMIRTEHA